MMKHKLTAMLLATLLTLAANAQWSYPVPEYTGFSIAEDAMHTDTMYLYNVGAQAYLTDGNAWDTQAMMDDTGMLVCFSKYVPDSESGWDGKTYIINDYCRSKKSWMQMYIDNEEWVFVDHAQQGNNCWLFQIEENNDQTFRIFGADISKYSHDNYPGTYLGVREDIDGSFEGDIYKSRPCVNNNVLPLLNPDEVKNDNKVAYHVDWAFVTKAEFERLKEKVEIYNESVELLRLMRGANSLGIDTAKEQEVYNNPESTLAEIKDAIISIKNKTPNRTDGWLYPGPVTTEFHIAEDANSTDTMYLYNVGAQVYLTEGNSWGTQASVGDLGLKLYFEKYIDDHEETGWDGKTYLIWDFSLYKNKWKNLFIDSETEMYVDHGSQGSCCWLFQIKDNGNGTFKIFAADDSKYAHAYYPSTYIGVEEYADGTIANTVSPLLNRDEMDKTKYAAYHTDWAFVTKEYYEAHQKRIMTYRASQKLLTMLEKAKALGIDTAAEQAVYNNTDNGLEQLEAATSSVKEKIALHYETVVKPSSPMSMDEEYVINTTFDTTDFWVTTTGAQVTGTARNKTEETGRDGEYHFTGTFWENWAPSYFTGKMYRRMEYMPKGVYRLELSAFANYGKGSYVYMDDDSVEVNYASPERYEVMSFNDTGIVEIGLKEVKRQSNWIGIDNCHLTYFGYGEDVYAYVIEELIASFSTDALFYNQLRTEYEALTLEYTPPVTSEEAKNFYRAITAKQQEISECIKAYDKLRTMIDDIMKCVEDGSLKPTHEGGVLAIEAESKMTEGLYTTEEALETARELQHVLILLPWDPANNFEYRPFIEEDKVWRVCAVPVYTENLNAWLEIYYFDGDTIIDDKSCKRMMLKTYDPETPASYVGAWYEEERKVYFAAPNQSLRLMYDFSVSPSDTIQFDDNHICKVLSKTVGGIDGFKGMNYTVSSILPDSDDSHTDIWLEGIGSLCRPVVNMYLDDDSRLLSCTVGDEVIYYNEEFDDDWSSLLDPETPKRRIDFTHTVKVKPKAPARWTNVETEESLIGEYNDRQLCIRLGALRDAYIVNIKDQNDSVVYTKSVRANEIVALNIDISDYDGGDYTINIENSDEVFSGVFSIDPTAIHEIASESKESGQRMKEVVYDLTGRPVSKDRLTKGIYIQNGKKVLVR